jgi:hypothetical protein
MMVTSGRKMRVCSITAGLAIGLSMASGCHQEEEVPTSAPPSPLPTADSSRPPQPLPPKSDQGGETNKVGSVGRDLGKDLASPTPEHGASTTFPPAGKPDSATRPDRDTRAGQP